MNDNATPTNTSEYPSEVLLMGHMGDRPGRRGFIEEMERNGQAQLVASTVLPTDTRGKDAEFEALGFTFGAPVSGDPLFREATLPEGWTKRGTDHDMHSEILDERGIARVNIFYKAAYYDRKADMSITNVGYRFATEWIYGDDTPAVNPLFTADELRSVLRQVEHQREEIARSPQVYEKNAPRVDSLEAAVTARLAELS